MDNLTDASLVADALAGREEAFASLVRKYQDYAYGTAVAMVSDFDQAADVVQEAFLCAYRNLGKLREPGKFGVWLHGIVRHSSLRAVRELARVRKLAEQMGRMGEPMAANPTPAESAEEAERRRTVRRALGRLSETNREAVSLYYVDGLSYADIAGYLGVTKATVQGRLQRGRAELRKDLTMVAETFKDERLPEDFAAEVRRLLDAADVYGRRHEDVIRQLAAIGAPAVEPLCAALGDPRIPVRRAAAKALCTIGDARALRPILQVLYTKDWQTGNAILRDGRVLTIPGVKAELMRIVRGGDADEQYWAIQALTGAVGDPQVSECLENAYRNGETVPLNIRRTALAALCSVRPELARQLIGEALLSPEFRRHGSWVWWAMVRSGCKLPIETCLLGFGRDVAPVGRLFAGHLVRRHGDVGRKVLAELLETGSPDHRATAAMALAVEGHDGAFEVLKDELIGGYAEKKWVRTVTRVVAQRFGMRLADWADAQGPRLPDSPGIAWALARVRLGAGDGTAEDHFRYGTPSVRAAALRTRARRRGAELLPELREHLRQGQPRKVAQEAFWRMLALGDAAVATAQAMLASEHWTERKAAVCLLRRWGKLTRAQHAQAEADPHVAVRHAANWRWPRRPAGEG